MALGYDSGLVIAITGHRVYPDRAALYTGLDRYQAKEYLFGGAQGVDTDALDYIAKTQPRAVRTVVVPNRVINQPAVAQAAIRQHATRVVELGNTGADRYMIRNRYMVDRSTRVEAFYDFRGSGGTYNTIKYARSVGRDITVQPMQEFNIEQFRSMSQPELKAWIKSMREAKVNLRAVKKILLQIMKELLNQTVQDLSLSLGQPEANTLEQLWYG